MTDWLTRDLLPHTTSGDLLNENTEPEHEYVRRVSNLLSNLSGDVLGQWLWDHPHEVSRYDWLDVPNLGCQKEVFSVDQLTCPALVSNSALENVAALGNSVSENRRRLVRMHSYFDEFGTWPRPPILLALSPGELVSAPEWVRRPFHLVEGTKRMILFRAMAREVRKDVRDRHDLWVLSPRQPESTE